MAHPQWWIGISITVASNVLISVALNCQKLAHVRLNQKLRATAPNEETGLVSHQTRGVSYLRSQLWWTGFALMVLGESGNFMSYGFAPASLVAPLGAVSLLSNVIVAPALLHEHIQAMDLAGIVLAIFGAVAVVSSAGPSGSDPLGPRHLWAALMRPTFVAYTAVMVVLAGMLMGFCATRIGKRSILAHVGVCAVFGGFTVLSTKGISSFLVLNVGGSAAWMLREPLFYLLLVVLVSTAVAQLAYLNRALQLFDSRHVIPTQFVLFTISTIVGSAILYRDFASMSWARVTGFIVGLLTTFLGVFVLTCGPNALVNPHVPESDGPVEIVVDTDADPSQPIPVQVSAAEQGREPQTRPGSRRRAYTAPSLDEVRPIQRPRQKLANMAAALVEQSQSYLRGNPASQEPTRMRPRRPMGTSTSLTNLHDLDKHLHAPPSPAFLGISPGRNLLLIPSQGTPSLLPLDLPQESEGHAEPDAPNPTPALHANSNQRTT